MDMLHSIPNLHMDTLAIALTMLRTVLRCNGSSHTLEASLQVYRIRISETVSKNKTSFQLLEVFLHYAMIQHVM